MVNAPDAAPPAAEDSAHIVVSRAALELEHRLLLARVQQLRELLGLDPLLTGKQQRKQERG